MNTKKHKGLWEDKFEAKFEAYKVERSGESTGPLNGSITSFLIPKYGETTHFVYKSISLLVDCKTVLPFTFCDDPAIRTLLGKYSISSKSLKKWIHKLADAMTQKIKNNLPKTFGIIF